MYCRYWHGKTNFKDYDLQILTAETSTNYVLVEKSWRGTITKIKSFQVCIWRSFGWNRLQSKKKLPLYNQQISYRFAGQIIVKTHHCGLGTHDIVNAFWNILEDNFETGICQHFHWFSSRDLKFKMGMNNFKFKQEKMDSVISQKSWELLEKKALHHQIRITILTPVSLINEDPSLLFLKI